MSETIYRGENRLIQREMFYSDGTTPLPYSSLAAGCSVELRQGDTVVKTLTAGTDAELRGGSTSTSILIELTSTLTNLLSPGVALTLRWKLRITDTRFTVEPGVFIDFTSEEIFDVSA